jgi:hypothetical protein
MLKMAAFMSVAASFWCAPLPRGHDTVHSGAHIPGALEHALRRYVFRPDQGHERVRPARTRTRRCESPQRLPADPSASCGRIKPDADRRSTLRAPLHTDLADGNAPLLDDEQCDVLAAELALGLLPGMDYESAGPGAQAVKFGAAIGVGVLATVVVERPLLRLRDRHDPSPSPAVTTVRPGEPVPHRQTPEPALQAA